MALIGSAGGRRVRFANANHGNSEPPLPFKAEQLRLGRGMNGVVCEPRHRLDRRIALRFVARLEVSPQEDAAVADLCCEQAARKS
jgi:hypothetical protein